MTPLTHGESTRTLRVQKIISDDHGLGEHDHAMIFIWIGLCSVLGIIWFLNDLRQRHIRQRKAISWLFLPNLFFQNFLGRLNIKKFQIMKLNLEISRNSPDLWLRFFLLKNDYFGLKIRNWKFLGIEPSYGFFEKCIRMMRFWTYGMILQQFKRTVIQIKHKIEILNWID